MRPFDYNIIMSQWSLIQSMCWSSKYIHLTNQHFPKPRLLSKAQFIEWLQSQIYVPDTQPLYSVITEPLQQTNGDLGSVAASCPAVWVQSLRCADRGINCVATTRLKSDTWQPCSLLQANKHKHTVWRLPIKCQLDASQVHCLIFAQITEE